MKPIIFRWATGLAASLLVGIVGLFGSGGTPSVSAQADTTAPTISSICDRTLQVQDVILARLAAVSDCALVTESDLNGILGGLELSKKPSLQLTPGISTASTA